MERINEIERNNFHVPQCKYAYSIVYEYVCTYVCVDLKLLEGLMGKFGFKLCLQSRLPFAFN